MTHHRIIHHSMNHEGIPTPYSLWEGTDAPDIDQITAAQQHIQNIGETDGRDPFTQRMDDLIAIQKQRTPAILGWKTIQVVNAFDTHDNK